MSEEKLLRDIWKAKNFWLSIYWSMREAAKWSIGWWDKSRFAIRLGRLALVYRPPKARSPKGSPIMSTKGCAGLVIGAAVVFAFALINLYLLGLSWKIVIGVAAAGTIFGLVLAITVAILDWRVE